MYKRIKELELFMDEIYAPRKQVSSKNSFNDDTREIIYFDKIINLSGWHRVLFFCKQENNQLKRLLRFEVPLQ